VTGGDSGEFNAQPMIDAFIRYFGAVMGAAFASIPIIKLHWPLIQWERTLQ